MKLFAIVFMVTLVSCDLIEYPIDMIAPGTLMTNLNVSIRMYEVFGKYYTKISNRIYINEMTNDVCAYYNPVNKTIYFNKYYYERLDNFVISFFLSHEVIHYVQDCKGQTLVSSTQESYNFDYKAFVNHTLNSEQEAIVVQYYISGCSKLTAIYQQRILPFLGGRNIDTEVTNYVKEYLKLDLFCSNNYRIYGIRSNI